MPIRMVQGEYGPGPHFFCQVCDEVVGDLEEANAEWPQDHAGTPLEGVFFVHKACTQSFRKSIDSPMSRYATLSGFLVQLAVNHDLDWPKAWEAALVDADPATTFLSAQDKPSPPWMS